MSVFLGIDAGTQSLKVIAYDTEHKEILFSESATLQLISRNDGTREQEASWWIDALRDCMTALPAELRARVCGIGVSGQQHGLVPLDGDGEVLAPVKLWCDTATLNECDEITTRFGGEARAVDMLGNPIMAGYTAPKITWLKNHNPQAYDQLAHILLPHDYLNYYLTGEIFTEYGDASGTGYLDITRREYSQEMLRALDPERDLSQLLPRLLSADESIPLSKAAQEEFGLPDGVIVATGGGDNMMAAWGTGSVCEGRLTLSLGTSGTLFAHSDKPAIDPEGELAAFCSSTGGWLPLLCTMNCTVATETIRQLLDKSLDECEQLLANSQPGADGVLTLPFFNGERTPNLPEATAAVFGLTPGNTTSANLYRSAMEGATFTLRRGLEAFARAGQSFTRIRLTGGGSRSPHWRQMIADIFNLPVEVLQQQEGAALGAALQAAWVSEPRNDTQLADWLDQHLVVDNTNSCTPNPDSAERYQPHYQAFGELLARLSPVYAGE